MCDLFALCAARSHGAAGFLPLFAARGRRNVHGWGIGFFRGCVPVVEKSPEPVFRDGRAHDSFQRLARVVAKPIILAHIRYRSSGKVDECHAHPFTLDFWGQSWLFAHNGEAGAIESY
ncbi:MAG: class II glutamine amidotransferase, partial [Desulfobaccales bacterium]